jgi:hypothetical protein
LSVNSIEIKKEFYHEKEYMLLLVPALAFGGLQQKETSGGQRKL